MDLRLTATSELRYQSAQQRCFTISFEYYRSDSNKHTFVKASASETKT